MTLTFAIAITSGTLFRHSMAATCFTQTWHGVKPHTLKFTMWRGKGHLAIIWGWNMMKLYPFSKFTEVCRISRNVTNLTQIMNCRSGKCNHIITCSVLCPQALIREKDTFLIFFSTKFHPPPLSTLIIFCQTPKELLLTHHYHDKYALNLSLECIASKCN